VLRTVNVGSTSEVVEDSQKLPVVLTGVVHCPVRGEVEMKTGEGA